MQFISPLLTDLYQITMAYGYWRLNMHNQEAVFQTIFRSHPFKGNYAISCGLETVMHFLESWKFSAEDINYLRSLKGNDGDVLFTNDFLDYLQNLKLNCDIDAVPEGNLIFAHEPFIRIKGPLLQCQLIESTILNIVNFQTLVATKASRVCLAAHHDPVIEFGMRRAQGPDGALSASRAAYIGGCVATSNVLAGKLFDIPVKGTHAHSWVSAFPNELAAFEAYVDAMPQNTILLVDTYNTEEGIKNAIRVGKKLRANGRDLLGIRLDSGDLAHLSKKARVMLDAEGFTQTQILASNSLDEYSIQELKQKGAKINAWGVGTNLTTAYDCAALDGVYKLTALKNKNGAWDYKLKLSEQEIKTSNPGVHQVKRYYHQDKMLGDVIFDINSGIGEKPNLLTITTPPEKMHLPAITRSLDLLQPVIRNGKRVLPEKSIHDIRSHAQHELSTFHKYYGVRPYLVGLEKNVYDAKQQMIVKVREHGG